MTGYIIELLRTHDCVIIPGLGGLIGHYEPARRNRASGTMMPPMKRVAFNQALRHNDGLLIHYAARRENITYEESRQRVDAYCNAVMNALRQNGSYLLAGIGKLSYDTAGQLHFHPILKENLLLDTYGLPLIVAQPVPRMAEAYARMENAPAVSDAYAAELAGVPDPHAPLYRHWIFRAAAVIGMAFLLTTAGLNLKDGHVSSDRLSLFPASGTKPEAFLIDESIFISFPETGNFHLYDLAAVTEIEIADAPAIAREGISALPQADAAGIKEGSSEGLDDKFYIIIGSFLDDARMNRDILEMRSKGFEVATIPGPNGYTRVGLVFNGRLVNRNAMLVKVRAEINPDAWLIGG